ncbi:MAG: ABC transporter permease [Ectothiorhodospiraceae bacterium]|nr:ABC transporter permease [Ectothiorhodospiraceae bacterium]
MRTYIIHKLLHALGVAFVISFVSFFLLFYTADPASMLLPENADDQDIARFKAAMGLDRPLVVQYLDWLRRIVLEADFGISWVAKIPARELIGASLWPTVQLAIAAQIIATVLAVPLGVLSAVKRYSFIDNITTLLALIGQALPLFWLGIMLIIIFGVWLKWLPTSGSDTWVHLVLPAITLASFTLPLNMRLVRSGMLEVLGQDYVRTARAKGVAERQVLAKHALRNAAIPLVTVTGLQFGALLGGAVVTETVFSWPGLGRLAVQSIQVGDFPVVQGVVLIFAAFTILANLAADIGSAWIDPRIRFD